MFAEAYTGKIWKVESLHLSKNKDESEKILQPCSWSNTVI